MATKTSSYEQVMLDVDRCAGRLEHLRQVYLHRTDDDEPPEDLTEALELQRLAEGSQEQSSSDLSEVEESVNKAGDDAEDGKDKDVDSSNDQDSNKDRKNQYRLKVKLADLIVGLLEEKPNLYYYQGFHDVCLTYMTILGDKDAYVKLSSLIDTHFSIFMQPTMNETQDFLALIPMIVGLQDSKLQDFLEMAEVGTIFALSWVITWFSHVIPNQFEVEKIFKFLEEHDPHMVLYLSAAIVMNKREMILGLEPEMSTVHHFLCQVPRKEKLPLEELLGVAKRTYSRWPPEVVKQKLDDYRRAKLQVHNTNIIRHLAYKFGPVIASAVSTNTRTAIVVLVVASALALQFDRWFR